MYDFVFCWKLVDMKIYIWDWDELVFLLDWYYGIWCDDEGSEN